MLDLEVGQELRPASSSAVLTSPGKTDGLGRPCTGALGGEPGSSGGPQRRARREGTGLSIATAWPEEEPGARSHATDCPPAERVHSLVLRSARPKTPQQEKVLPADFSACARMALAALPEVSSIHSLHSLHSIHSPSRGNGGPFFDSEALAATASFSDNDDHSSNSPSRKHRPSLSAPTSPTAP
eukprot:RCo023747